MKPGGIPSQPPPLFAFRSNGIYVGLHPTWPDEQMLRCYRKAQMNKLMHTTRSMVKTVMMIRTVMMAADVRFTYGRRTDLL